MFFVLGAALSLCYVPGVTGAYIATQWPLLSLVLPFALLLRGGTFTMQHLYGLLFVAYAVLSVSWCLTPYASVFGLWLLTLMSLSVWLGTTMENVRGLYAGLAVGGAVSSVIAVYQYFGSGMLPMTSDMPAGLYINSVQQGTVLALLAVALITERMWLWAVLLAPGLILASSRGAWLAFVIGLLACYLRRVWVFGILGVAGLWLLLTPLGNSDQTRMLIWEQTFDNLSLLGWGPGSFYTVLLFENGRPFFPEHAHNDALQLVFEYGVGAVLPFLVAGFALTRSQAKEWPIFVAFIAAGCYSMPLWMPLASFLGLVSLGRILRDHGEPFAIGHGWRRYVFPWRHRDASESGIGVSVASGHQT